MWFNANKTALQLITISICLKVNCFTAYLQNQKLIHYEKRETLMRMWFISCRSNGGLNSKGIYSTLFHHKINFGCVRIQHFRHNIHYLFETANMMSPISPSKTLINLSVLIKLFLNPLCSDEKNLDGLLKNLMNLFCFHNNGSNAMHWGQYSPI